MRPHDCRCPLLYTSQEAWLRLCMAVLTILTIVTVATVVAVDGQVPIADVAVVLLCHGVCLRPEPAALWHEQWSVSCSSAPCVGPPSPGSVAYSLTWHVECVFDWVVLPADATWGNLSSPAMFTFGGFVTTDKSSYMAYELVFFLVGWMWRACVV